MRASSRITPDEKNREIAETWELQKDVVRKCAISWTVGVAGNCSPTDAEPEVFAWEFAGASRMKGRGDRRC